MSHTLFVAGRYNKYSRTISQTPWFVDGDKKVADSVEGFIIDALKRLLPHQRKPLPHIRNHVSHPVVQTRSSSRPAERMWTSGCWDEDGRSHWRS